LNTKCKIDRDKRTELVNLHIAGGAKKVKAKAKQYGVDINYVRRAAVHMGLRQGRSHAMWARARAIGAIVA
jgi:hypothetical protein